MAYYTGAATSPSNLIDTIKLALQTEGWTINAHGADTGFSGASQVDATQTKATASRFLAVTSPAGQHFMMLAFDAWGTVGVTAHTSAYASGSNRDNQGGMPWGTGQARAWSITNNLTGPYTAYYLFIGTSYCHVVVERTTNNFSHFHIGLLEKAGNYVGGEYVTGTMWQFGNTSWQHSPDSEHNMAPFDSVYYQYNIGVQHIRYDSTWFRLADNYPSSFAKGFLRGHSIVHRLMERNPNTFNALTVLQPSLMYGPVPSQTGATQIYGTVKDLRPVNIAYLSPKQLITIGADEWMVFPIIRKGWTANTEACSGNYALAYRKVT